jgi:CubicO group peptidase (beta-lactamase class C family)
MNLRFLILSAVISCFFFWSCDDSGQKISGEPEVNVAEGQKNLNVDLKVSEQPEHVSKAREIESLIRQLNHSKQFNGSVLVADKGKVVYMGAIGEAVFSSHKTVTVNTPFHLASVSKQFTAMAIMLLKEEGKLKYDDSISRFFPDFPYGNITVRQLLQHTSGIPRITDYLPLFLSFWDTCKIARNEDLPRMLSALKPGIQFYPGRRFSYNNTGYIMLALIVEKASGMSYDKYVEKKIFKPLGMNNSFIYDIHDLNSFPHRALGYAVYRNSYVPDEDDIRNGMVGEKGVYASAVDMFKWDQALYTEKLVKAETLKEAFSRGKLENGKEIDYGFGWRMPRKESDIVYHFGHWRGFRTGIIRVMDDQYTIIILNNTGSRKIKFLATKILDILYEGKDGKPEI